ncbi:MAG TPA: ABC transporter substrate-binding protein, partial [Amycolatopsis sp.]|nr:ABC transporter substrate-binding protein [Amycolatopsis sp.]
DGLEALGMQLVKNIEVGRTENSYAAQVGQLVSAGATCIVPIIAPGEVAKLMTATQQSGQKILIGGVTAAFSQDLLNSLGKSGDGILLAGANYLPTDTQIPAVQDMINAMKQYTPQTPPTTTYGTAAWGAATLLFSSVMPTINGTIDSASVMTALQNTTNATVGTYAPYTFAKQPPAAQFPRLRNTGILLWKVQDSMPHLESPDFTDIYKTVPLK